MIRPHIRQPRLWEEAADGRDISASVLTPHPASVTIQPGEAMRIIYTRHARQRMIQRKVSEDQIADALSSPDALIASESGEEIAVKRFGTREVRVVYRETDAETILIYTVMKPHVRN
jgi:hypothetical protein